MTTRRFAGSFRPVSKKKNCTKLKDHYTGAMRELVGILDLWAANDHERFVFARVSEIRKRCKYFKTDTSYGPRWIEKGAGRATCAQHCQQALNARARP